MARSPIVIGKWKMNGSMAANSRLLEGLAQFSATDVLPEVVVCAPFVYLSQARDLLANSSVKYGVQNVAYESAGAFTGEVSVGMTAEFGASHVIVGHSERRALFAETDDVVAKKTALVLAEGLTPIVCVGETAQQKEGGNTRAIVAQQLEAVMTAVGVSDLEKIIVAYEPVWAIGSGVSASVEQIQSVHGFIREMLATVSIIAAEKVQILYGGSVNGTNAAEIFSLPDVDGGLIGGASLEVDSFCSIIRAATKN